MDLPVQLRRPPGHLFHLPRPEKRDAIDRCATRHHRRRIYVGVRGERSICGMDCRPVLAEVTHPWRSDLLVGGNVGNGVLPRILAARCGSGSRGAGRVRVLPCFDVAPERLPRSEDAFPRHVHSSIERVRGHHRGRHSGGLHGSILRLAVELPSVRLVGNRAGDCAYRRTERAAPLASRNHRVQGAAREASSRIR